MSNKMIQIAMRAGLLAAMLGTVVASAVAADKWTAPTAEELAMTAQKEVPGAPAVYLFREDITDDHLHMWSTYARIKVLNEKGKEYANVELRQFSESAGFRFTMEDIAGRTIHPDGTIIPFTGKPYQKLIQKGKGTTVTAKVFTLPDVEVGSIIEYRYVMRYDDHYFVPPQWFIQSNLYTRKAHYYWRPTGEHLTNERGDASNSVAWTPVLPPGATVKETVLPAGSRSDVPQSILELNVQNISPLTEEEYMPPMQSLSYRVLFYYAQYHTLPEYWKNEGKFWSKKMDKFIGPGGEVAEAVGRLVAPGDTQEQKLKKIYAAVMALENTDFTREHSKTEDQATGGAIKTSDDVWKHKRGSGDQIAQLFVAMARSAGMKAYVMGVSDRRYRMFISAYLNLGQLDDLIAIVNVDGKDKFFDPGQRYCPYGQLAWQHGEAQGLRQNDGGTELSPTPRMPYLMSRTQRLGDLNLDQQGEVSGKLTLKFTGAPALRWRQAALRGDQTSLELDLQVAMEQMLPKGVDVKVSSVEKVTDYEEPLVVNYTIKGAVGSSTGKRMLLPGDIFAANTGTTFPHEKREMPVFFEYSFVVQDAVRVKFPAAMAIESVPPPDKQQLKNVAAYTVRSETTPTSYTVRRDFTMGDIFFEVKDYPELRSFYTKMENKDQEGVVLKAVTTAAPAGN